MRKKSTLFLKYSDFFYLLKKKTQAPLTVLLLAILFSSTASAQNDTPTETYFQHWTRLAETPSRVDVYYRVIRCGNGPSQVHLKIFNESAADQLIKFNLEIANPNGEKMTKEIEFSTEKAKIYTADCTSDESTNALKINLPEKFYPYTVKISIVMKP